MKESNSKNSIMIFRSFPIYMFFLPLKEMKKKTFLWVPPLVSAVASAEAGPGKLAAGTECISNTCASDLLEMQIPRPCLLRFRFSRSGVWPRNLHLWQAL